MFHHKNLSVYLALVVWGVSAFQSQPNLSSLITHFLVEPLALAALIAIAHLEGKNS